MRNYRRGKPKHTPNYRKYMEKKIRKYLIDHFIVSQHMTKTNAVKKMNLLNSSTPKTVNHRIIPNKAPNKYPYAVQRTKQSTPKKPKANPRRDWAKKKKIGRLIGRPVPKPRSIGQTRKAIRR